MSEPNAGFADALAQRLAQHQSYWEAFSSLQSTGASSTLPSSIDRNGGSPSEIQIAKLLYCASVFSQTNDDHFRTMAQSIALNCLLIEVGAEARERCARVLTELGNFPGLHQVESRYEIERVSLMSLIQRRVSEELNTVRVSNSRISLTDYQKTVWDALPQHKAIAISAPTSAGKSFLVIEHACRLAERNENFAAVYIAPTRALLGEVQQRIKDRIGDAANIRISSVPAPDLEGNSKQLYVLTQERLQALLAVSNVRFDLVIVDEAQNLSDGARGMILQECLEHVIHRNPDIQTIFLSPGAEGFSDAAAAVGLHNIIPARTNLSPVLQNRILVKKVPGCSQLDLALLTARGVQKMGTLSTSRGFDVPDIRLASVALELGSTGGSLVYATGPSNAETVALQLAQDRPEDGNKELIELSKFIREHIHPEYKLASFVRRGVAFHYGKMPTLLREALESAFSSGSIKFLACTTTLFQGVNLPARNVFIDTPTRGKGTVMDPALLWNFAGRAGRMKKDIVGNVFLIDYDEWPAKSMDNFVSFHIKPALKTTLSEDFENVIGALSGSMPALSPSNDMPSRVRAAAGLLISRAAKGDIERFISRIGADMSESKREQLVNKARDAATILGLPAELLATNWTIDPFGQRRLFDRICEKIAVGDLDTLIPINPHEPAAGQVYGAIFTRILRAVFGQKGKFGGFVSGLAIQWMKGVPYPVILGKAVDREKSRLDAANEAYEMEKSANPKTRKRRPKPVDISSVIRDVFDIVEDVVRFQFVQLGRAYIDLLAIALRDTKDAKLVDSVFDFSLALELGISTQSGRAFVELGLSRIAASTFERIYPNSNLTVTEARNWLRGADLLSLNLSTVLVDELRRLKLTA